MGAGEKSSRPMEFVESASRRLCYRLRREHYAKIAGLEAASQAEVEPQAVSRVLAEREQKIAKLAEDNASLRDIALRVRADLDNARKRFQREKSETIKFATEQLVRELVVVLDNLERALASADDGADTKAVHDGVQMVLDQFTGILRANGLEAIATDGRQFDPHFHEAVSTEDREDVVDNQIVATFQKGYLLRGRVVRPAMVRVGRAVRPAPAAEMAAASAEPNMTSEETIADLDDATQNQTESAGEQASGSPDQSPDK